MRRLVATILAVLIGFTIPAFAQSGGPTPTINGSPAPMGAGAPQNPPPLAQDGTDAFGQSPPPVEDNMPLLIGGGLLLGGGILIAVVVNNNRSTSP